MNNKKRILGVIATISILILIIGYNYYSDIYSENVKSSNTIYIPSSSTKVDFLKLITPYVKDTSSLAWVLDKKKYSHRIKAGKYTISEGMNNNELVNLLRSGKQTPVNLSFNNQHNLEALAGRIATQIEADSIELIKAFTDEVFLTKNGFNKATALAMYIPNSYQIYWNSSAENFRDKMLREYNSFWSQTRTSKAKRQNLSPIQVISLAAIVQKETAHVSERPTVAGLYLNRYHKKWPLQSDPTVIFALKQKHGQDFEVKRVLNKDLHIDSPYNTYKYRGIPPGPIAMPDISSIDAVLNPHKHNYFYMCASVEDFGKHAFAKNLSEHNKNARKYQRWLSQQGINR